MLFLLFLLSSLFGLVFGIAIDNGIVGDPSIACMDNGIHFEVKTQKPFAGRIFAKGKVNDKECVKSDYAQQKTTSPSLDLMFGNCGIRGLKTTEPQGMTYVVTVVVSFHPMFLTKVDKAYYVKCLFTELKSAVTANIGVSMIPTTEALATRPALPCSYTIHKGTFSQIDDGMGVGPPVNFAQVGDKILHRWECADAMYGIFLHDCVVWDGFNESAQVIDSRGCPVDPILISAIRYSSNLTQAFAESHVFKFADKPGLFFTCQIQQCLIMSGSCNGLTPPACAITGTSGGTGSPVIGGSSTQNPSNRTPRNTSSPINTPSPTDVFSRNTTPMKYTQDGSRTTATTQGQGPGPPFGYAVMTTPPSGRVSLVYQADEVFNDAKKRSAAGDLFEKIALERESSFWNLKHNGTVVAKDEIFTTQASKDISDNQELSGKLIIFDLDEKPPNYYQTSSNSLSQDEYNQVSSTSNTVVSRITNDQSSQCVVSSQGLVMILATFGAISGILLIIVFSTCMKFRRQYSSTQCQQQLDQQKFHHNGRKHRLR